MVYDQLESSGKLVVSCIAITVLESVLVLESFLSNRVLPCEKDEHIIKSYSIAGYELVISYHFLPLQS